MLRTWVFEAFLVLCFAPAIFSTMLTDSVATRKPPSMKKCLMDAKREINLGAIPQECHDDIQNFYCKKVRDVASKRYKEPLKSDCKEAGLIPTDPNLLHLPASRASLGFVILMHQFPENVKRLVMRLYEPETTAFAVHVDTKRPDLLRHLQEWKTSEDMEAVVDVFSDYNVVRGGSGMLNAELAGMKRLFNSSILWDFCILLSEQDYPLRANRVLAEYLWVHRTTNFISVDEGECERDVSYQCGDRVVSLSGGSQFPKIPEMRYGSGSQWFAITRSLASHVVSDFKDTSTIIGSIYADLTSVKQPDESFFQAIILNTRFCDQHIDYTLHWTDKNSMREVRSDTSEYSILSPGVLHSGADFFKIAEVRKQSLWAFFARKFDDSSDSMSLKNQLDHAALQSARVQWQPATVPVLDRVVQGLASSMGIVEEVARPDRNKDSLFGIQTLRIRLRSSGREDSTIYVREKLAVPTAPHPVLALRVGCSWNKTELVFEGDVSLISSSPTGPYSCESLWAVAHWRMSRKQISQQLVLVWVDPKGTPMQHAPINVNEHSVLIWHRYTATLPLPHGYWTLQLLTPDRAIVAQRRFFVYSDPSQVPWSAIHQSYELILDDMLI